MAQVIHYHGDAVFPRPKAIYPRPLNKFIDATTAKAGNYGRQWSADLGLCHGNVQQERR